jgi:hypothetical protein
MSNFFKEIIIYDKQEDFFRTLTASFKIDLFIGIDLF